MADIAASSAVDLAPRAEMHKAPHFARASSAA